MYTNKRYSWLYNHSNIISIKIIKVKQRTFMTNFGKDINSVLFSKANNLLEVLFINWLDVYKPKKIKNQKKKNNNKKKKKKKNAEKKKQIYQKNTTVERWSLSALYPLSLEFLMSHNRNHLITQLYKFFKISQITDE